MSQSGGMKNSNSELTGKRKVMTSFNFSPNKVTKLSPTGNLINGTEYPKPRSGHRVVYRNGNLYAFGGYAALKDKDTLKHVLYAELWKYNYATKTWKLLKTKGAMPKTLASHCAFLTSNQMLVFGGTGVPFGETISDSMHVCNLDTLEWKELETTGSPPQAQYGQAMGVHDNKVYIVGGTNGFTYCMDVHCLDLNTKMWKKLETVAEKFSMPWEPKSRYRHEIAIYDNKLFIFGGGDADESYDLKDLPVFDLETCKWSTVQTSGDHPEKRRCHGCVQMGKEIYICGGLNGSVNPWPIMVEFLPPIIYSDMWKLNLESLHWEKLSADLPSSVYFHSAAVSESGQMFVFGGVNSTSNTRTNNLFSVWLKIPSLAEMAWNAFLKYVPNVASLSDKKLYEMGVPFNFIKETDFEASEKVAIPKCCDHSQS